MQFHKPTADLCIPDAAAMPAALSRTTRLCICAHQDDIEIEIMVPAAYRPGFVQKFGADGETGIRKVS